LNRFGEKQQRAIKQSCVIVKPSGTLLTGRWRQRIEHIISQ
jgi:hypothetical protein